MTIERAYIDSRTLEGRKALRFMTISTKQLLSALNLPPKEDRAEYYTKATLCLMAVAAGLSLRDFHQ